MECTLKEDVNYNGLWECSVCKSIWCLSDPESEEYYYCPKCGSKIVYVEDGMGRRKRKE
jgi:DNA-directed RNA polymerase subunit RPC12/RpoP